MNPVIHYVIHKKYYKEILCVKRNIPGNCCEGKCQLKKEISKTEKTNENPTAIPIPKVQIENNYFCLIQDFDLTYKMFGKSKSLIIFKDIFVKIVYPDLTTPPPKF